MASNLNFANFVQLKILRFQQKCHSEISKFNQDFRFNNFSLLLLCFYCGNTIDQLEPSNDILCTRMKDEGAFLLFFCAP